MTARSVWAGVALAGAYVVVALVTNAVSSRPVLPLFDGFAPPSPYSWVTPPAEQAAANVAPQPAERDITLGAEGNEPTNVSTDEAQALVGLDKGSVPANPPDDAVKVTLVPFDAGQLAPLPQGLRPVSNAYRVNLVYLPSQRDVGRLAVNGTLALTAAEQGDKLLYSADGSQWEERPARPYGQDHGLFTELEMPGYFVVASSSVPQHAVEEAGPNVVLLSIAAAVPIIGAVLVLRLPSPVAARAPAIRRPPPKQMRRAAAKKARRGGRKPGQRRRRR